jgi:aspartate/methionine/tyrosine aminotransferase
VIYIVDPNNPLGTCCTAEEIAEIAEIAREVGAYLIHDCTYRDFAYTHHLAAKCYPERTITVWSFSKWLGLAGLRVGTLTGHPEVMERLANAPPNNLGSNILAQRAAIAGLKIKNEWLAEVLSRQRANQDRLHKAATAIPGLRLPVFPSNGNFLVVECANAGVRPETVCAVLARSNIMVRHGAYHTKTFGDRFIKISTTVPEEWMEELCERLPKAVEDARGMNEAGQLY